MKVGMIGCGKLGLPVAVAMDLKGHKVMGYDIDPARMSKAPIEYQEAGPDAMGDFSDYLGDSTVEFGSVAEVVAHSDVVFVAVQTPHHPEYEGVTPIPTTRRDFSYVHLVEACRQVCIEAADQSKELIMAVISTCLPGTMEREVIPMMDAVDPGGNVDIVYNPSFIAMTTTMNDFLYPEFVLLGSEPINDHARKVFDQFYQSMSPAKVIHMGIAEAELTKVAYNTFIGYKLIFVNAMMEICQKMSLDVDDVTQALCQSNRRLISPAYMRAGMGDGGGCHPRDQIALSYLAREIGLSHDIFEDLMITREAQARWLCEIVQLNCREHELKPFVLGTAYKPGTGLEIGSPAVLCKHYLGDCDSWDPYVDTQVAAVAPGEGEPRVFLIGTAHDEFEAFQFPPGSVVIDPWRMIPDQIGVEVIRIGER